MPQECEPYVQCAIPTWTSPIKNPATGRWITSHVINQDIVAWVGQGTIADRSRETLGASDSGITMLRRRFFAELTPSSPDEFEKNHSHHNQQMGRGHHELAVAVGVTAQPGLTVRVLRLPRPCIVARIEADEL